MLFFMIICRILESELYLLSLIECITQHVLIDLVEPGHTLMSESHSSHYAGSGHSCTHFLNISRAMVTLGLAGSLEVMRMRTWKRFFDVLQSRFSNPDKRLPGSAIGPDQSTRTCRIDDNDLLLPFSPSPPVHVERPLFSCVLTFLQ